VHSSFDKDRYVSLVSRAAFNMEAWRGTYQDQSRNQLAMAASGSPSFTMVNVLPALTQNAAGDGAWSAATASIVDTTLPFWIEALIVPPPENVYVFYQFSAGGWSCYFDSANSRIFLMTYTAVGGDARFCSSPIGSLPVGRPSHVVIGVDPVGLSGRVHVGGVPAIATFVNTAPPVVCGPATLDVCQPGGSFMRALIARAWQGTPSNEEAQTLYQAASVLCGGEV